MDVWRHLSSRMLIMTIRVPAFILILAALTALAANARGDDKKVYSGAACIAPVDEFFANEVWAKVGSQSCLECHQTGGDAEDSDFILLDPRKSGGGDQDAALRHNREQFVQMARLKKGDESR